MFTALQDKVPTHDELRGIIEKIAEFLQNFVKLFDQLKKGLAETFSTYTRTYEVPAGEEEE